MAKKSQTKARRNNTQMGQRVVNYYYNHGTVNIDARQNNSKSFRHENNGCTVNYPMQSAGNSIGDFIEIPESNTTMAVEHITSLPTKKKSASYTILRNIGVGIAAAAVAVGVSAVLIKLLS